MLIAQGCLLDGGDKNQIPVFQKAESGFVNNLGTLLLSVEADRTQIPPNDYPKFLFPRPLPIFKVDIFYVLLTSMLLFRDHTRF